MLHFEQGSEWAASGDQDKAQNKNHNTKQRVVVLRVLLQPYSFPLHINKHWKVSSHAHHNKTDRAAPYSVRFHLQQKNVQALVSEGTRWEYNISS